MRGFESGFEGEEVVALLEQVRSETSLDFNEDFSNDFTTGF